MKKSLHLEEQLVRNLKSNFQVAPLILECRFPLHFTIEVVFHPLRMHIPKFRKETYIVWDTFYTLCMEFH